MIFLRFILIISFSTLLTLTTTPLSLSDAVESLLKPLTIFKVPAHEIGLMLSLSLRFVPTLMDDTTRIMNAQKARGVDFDEGNIMDQAEKGMYLIDMTTTSPMISKKIYEEGKKKGVHVVDAPVTGGDTGAKAGTLSILVGGNKEDYEACMPLFEAMGTNLSLIHI